MNAHPLAEKFSRLSAEEMTDLVASIRDEGLLDPIVTIEHEGERVILDGINRFAACEQAGVKPRFQEFEKTAEAKGGMSPFRFVILKNVLRRHLTTGQRALFAAEVLPDYKAEAAERQAQGKAPSDGSVGRSGEATELAAADFKVGRTSVKSAAKVLKAAETGVKADGTKMTPKERERFAEQVERAKSGDTKVTVDGLAKKLAGPEPKAPKPSWTAVLLKLAAPLLKHLRTVAGSKLTLDAENALKELQLAIDAALGVKSK